MAEGASIDEELWKDASWLRCMLCFKSAKNDRNMVILSCSHTYCSSCFGTFERGIDERVNCRCCKKDGQFIRVFSPKVPQKLRNLLQPNKYDEQVAKSTYQQRQRDSTIKQLVESIKKEKAEQRAMTADIQRMEKEYAQLEQARRHARGRLFRGFTDNEVEKMLSMTIEQMDQMNIGRVIHEKITSPRRQSTERRQSIERRQSTERRPSIEVVPESTPLRRPPILRRGSTSSRHGSSSTHGSS